MVIVANNDKVRLIFFNLFGCVIEGHYGPLEIRNFS